MRKKIAVITSVFNGEKYIESAINSVLRNNKNLFDYYILDNGSTDKTLDIINKFRDYKNLFIQKNLKVVSRTKALNQLISKIRDNYEFFMNVDADDLIEKNWLINGYNFMENHSHISLLSGQFFLINSKNEAFVKSKIPIYPEILNNYFSYTFPVVHSGLLVRLKDIKTQNVYNENLSFGQDWDLCINIALKGKISSINNISVYFRHHDESLTKSLSNQLQSRYDKLYNLRNGSRLSNSLKLKLINKNREASEILAIAYLNFKKNNFLKSIKYFILGFITFPFSIFLNYKILSKFNSNRIFTYKIKKWKI